jgi:hypothetical protein
LDSLQELREECRDEYFPIDTGEISAFLHESNVISVSDLEKLSSWLSWYNFSSSRSYCLVGEVGEDSET